MNLNAKLYVLIAALFLLWSACRKVDRQTNNEGNAPPSKEVQFFTKHRPTNPQVQEIMQWLHTKNSKENFVNKTVAQIGYPRWDKALIQVSNSSLSYRGGTDTSFTLLLIPFVRDSQNYVNASMIVKTTATDTTMDYICDWQYQDFGFNPLSDTALRAKNIFHLFALFDNNTFGHTSFKLRDQRLYSHEDSLAIASNNIPFDSAQVIYTLVNTGVSGRGSGTGSYTITTCSDFTECISWGTSGFRNQLSSGRSGSLTGCVVSVSWTVCTSTLILEPGDLPTGGTSTPPTGTGGSGGGTGGGGSSTPPECGGPTTGSKTESNYNCGPGWTPIPDNPPPPANLCDTAEKAAKMIDTLRIKSKYDSVLTARVPDLATGTTEKGFAILKSFGINSQNVADTFITGYRADPYTCIGTDSSIVLQTTGMGIRDFLAAWLHIHGINSMNAHSAGDVFRTIQQRITNGPRFEGNIVVAANGNEYALTITNFEQAVAFLATSPQNQDNDKWKGGSDIGRAFKDAFDYHEAKYKGELNKRNLAYEMAMAAVLKEFNVGVTLNKKDASGNFEPLIVNTMTDPQKPKKKIYVRACI